VPPLPPDELAIMGRIAAPYAVRGWVKIQTFSEYLDSLLDFSHWLIGKNDVWREYEVLEAKVHGQFLVAQLDGVDDRNLAESLVGKEIAVLRESLPEPDEGEYYWTDLIGLQVYNQQGELLGTVENLLETGAHDVLKVKGEVERLIPFTDPIICEVDKTAGRILVDWGLDY